MSRQSVKNKLKDLVTGSINANEPRAYFLNEGDEMPDPKTLGPYDTVIIFEDFAKRNESSQETI